MNQCVPSGDPKLSFCNSFATTHHVPSSEYEVAELTWEKGQLAMYGLGPQRVHNKHPTDTLESIVDQATLPHSKSAAYKVVPWLDAGRRPSVTAATMDALVPCNNSVDDRENSTQVPGMGSCGVGSCSGAGAGGCLARDGCRSYASASASDTYGGREASLDDSYGGGPTSTSLWSPENTSSGEDYTKTSGEDRGFVTKSRSQRQQAGDRGNRKLGIGKSSILAKSKAAAVHNQSERRRRDKINQRMKTLQKMVPNSSKSDKASMLDEIIEYMKQLQAQVGMMSRMSMMMPSPMQLQMSMMAAAMGMGMPPPIMPAAAAFMPVMPWDIHPPPLTPQPDFLPNVFACQSQPMTMDGYSSRLAALYQQFQQSSSASKN